MDRNGPEMTFISRNINFQFYAILNDFNLTEIDRLLTQLVQPPPAKFIKALIFRIFFIKNDQNCIQIFLAGKKVIQNNF